MTEILIKCNSKLQANAIMMYFENLSEQVSNISLNDFLDKLNQTTIEEPSIDFENNIIDLT